MSVPLERGENITARHILLGHYINQCRKDGLVGISMPGHIDSDEVLAQVHSDMGEIEADIKKLKAEGKLKPQV